MVNIAKDAPGYSLVKTGTSNYTFSIDLTLALPNTPVVLQANTVYWLVFAAKTNLTAYTATTRFNHFAGPVVGNTAKLVDPSNAFNAGATNCTSLVTLTNTPALGGLAFSIEGTTLGVDEVAGAKQVTIYPNPVKDIATISNEGNKQLNFVSISDLNGKTVKSMKLNGETTEQVNISDLSAGVYMMNISSDQGSVTKKIIKN